KAATAGFPPRGAAAAAYAANMPPACLLTLRRRKNTLRGASVELSAVWGPRRSPAERVRWGEEAQRSERCLPLAAGDGMRSLCRRRAERSETPLAEKALAFFDSLSPRRPKTPGAHFFS